MRICMLSYRSYTYSGGQGVYLRYLSRALRDLGHTVNIASGPPYPELDDGIKLTKVPSLDLYAMPPSRRMLIDPCRLNSIPNIIEWAGIMTGYFSEPLAFGMRAYKLLRNNMSSSFDVVHDNQTMAYGILKVQKFGLPIVETIHHPVTIDRDLAIASTKSVWHKLGLRRWFSFVNMQIKVARQLPYIITVSQTACQHISKAFHLPPERLRVIYNGIDTEVFSPSQKVERLPNRLLTVISRDTPVKGLRYMLEALAELRKKYDIELTVVGRTLGGSATEEIIRDLGIGNNVCFIDQIDTAELVRQYRLATVLVVPSTYEGFGLPAAEGMACGTPVVATTAGALPEVVGDAGVLVSPANVPALVEGISALLDNPDKRHLLSAIGRKRIKQLFNWNSTAKKTADVYLEAINYRRQNAKL